jgi:hypothetical protein
MKSLLIFFTTMILIGCKRERTNDPATCYQYWAGEKPNAEVQVLHGQYGPTSRWTKDYEIYLQLKGTTEWCYAIIRKNHLLPGTEYRIPDDAPSWFRPDKKYRIWKPSGFDQSSFYLDDSESGNVYVYQVSL